ncbi:MAG: hypothetical protein KIS67_09110 [Verrucomicrobiae bacterium]|nr:hypothetical protein [Verrucomicrobiae bacterium]
MCSPTVFAQVALSPVAIAGSDLEAYAASTPFTNMINHSGVTVPFVSGATNFDAYFADPVSAYANANYVNNWQSEVSFDLPLTGYVDFDLGAMYSLNKMAIWNVTVENVTVTVFEELNRPGQVTGNFTLPNHWYNPFSYSVSILDFGGVYPGRYVRLTINSAYKYSASDNFTYAIIGEVVMSASPLVQLPSLTITRDQNGGVVVTFTGTLQSAASLNGDFVDVPGNPQGTYTIPKASLGAAEFFRARND